MHESPEDTKYVTFLMSFREHTNLLEFIEGRKETFVKALSIVKKREKRHAFLEKKKAEAAEKQGALSPVQVVGKKPSEPVPLPETAHVGAHMPIGLMSMRSRY